MRETARTKPHRDMEMVLDELGISYMSEFPILNYSADIYLPEWHLCLEIDGPTHTKYSLRDRTRDNRLRDVGVMTLRIGAATVKTEQAKSRVLQFIKYHAATAAERKRKWER